MIMIYNSDLRIDAMSTSLKGDEDDVGRSVATAERRNSVVDLYYHGEDGKPKRTGLESLANRVEPSHNVSYDPLEGKL